jgi:hypothetical protein
MEPILCQLQYAAGRVEDCPGEPCPFWADARCVVAGLRADLDSNPDLAHLLLDLRSDLLGQKPRNLFRLIHPPGLA